MELRKVEKLLNEVAKDPNRSMRYLAKAMIHIARSVHEIEDIEQYSQAAEVAYHYRREEKELIAKARSKKRQSAKPHSDNIVTINVKKGEASSALNHMFPNPGATKR